uniref:Uncharacterized protein n=1 Tax=viral metagenome TaxID=1070528 RepID=A0A6C0INW1_9ZZZZ
MKPLKSWLNIELSVKKHTKIKGASRKNKYPNAIKFKSILFILSLENVD